MSIRRLRQIFSSPDSAPAPQPVPVFSVPPGVRVYAVGDIHGRSQLLAKMMAVIRQHARAKPAEKIVEVFLGDYIDRGMQSKEVVDLLIAPPAPGHERVCLLGNHEETLLRFLTDPKILRDWANFGGYATLASYGVPIPAMTSPQTLAILRDNFQKNLPAEHEAFFRKLVLSHTIGDYLFVHAGVLPGVALDAQKPDHLLWIREPFLKYEGFFERYIVHGHTPVRSPDIHSQRANLDVTGAEQDSLCCLIIEGDQRSTILVTAEND